MWHPNISQRMMAITVVVALGFQVGWADTTPQTLPLSRNWTDPGLITVDDNWSGVPGIEGRRGDTLTAVTAVDPQTVVDGDDAAPVVDVNANRTDPNTFTTGGVAEFEIADPCVALQGSGTADAPYLLITINTTGLKDITVNYNLRDVDGSADNAVQPVALQYRIGTSGSFTNIPSGFVADATQGPSLATLVTAVAAVLPSDASFLPAVQIRIITTNAAGNDEWVGVDDISITGTPGTPSDNPDAGFSPLLLAFGPIAKEATSDLGVYVRNSPSSTQNLNITGLTFGGTDPGRFSLQTALPINGIAPGTSVTLTLRYTPGGVDAASHSATATLVSNDPNNPVLNLSGSTYLDVPDLATARAAATGVPIRITGIVTVNTPTNGLNAARNQLAVQDASGSDGQSGLFIDDAPNKLAQSYSVGDRLQNLAGTLGTFSLELQLVPDGPATLVGTGATVTPLLLTGAETLDNIESELIRIDGVSITTADTTWSKGTTGNNYTLNAAVGPISVIRIEDNSLVAGQPIPTGPFNVIGLCVKFTGPVGEIEPRFVSDVFQGSDVSDWLLYN